MSGGICTDIQVIKLLKFRRYIDVQCNEFSETVIVEYITLN